MANKEIASRSLNNTLFLFVANGSQDPNVCFFTINAEETDQASSADLDCHRCWSSAFDANSKCLRLRMDAVVLCVFLHELNRSKAFRCNVINNLYRIKIVARHRVTIITCRNSPKLHLPIKMFISWNQAAFLDIIWFSKLERLYVENVILDDTMAWLSTLGGAFSALGDEFNRCAQIAGKISRHQYKLASKLGDEIAISKCNLFLALSLIQLGRLKKAKQIIKQQYDFASSLSECSRDFRLINMCKGAWAKLKYGYSLRKQENVTC